MLKFKCRKYTNEILYRIITIKPYLYIRIYPVNILKKNRPTQLSICTLCCFVYRQLDWLDQSQCRMAQFPAIVLFDNLKM